MGRRKKILTLSDDYLSKFKYKVECIVNNKTITIYTDYTPIRFIRNMERYSELRNTIPTAITFYDNKQNKPIALSILDDKIYNKNKEVNYLTFRFYKEITP